jgi:hypothetical protein
MMSVRIVASAYSAEYTQNVAVPCLPSARPPEPGTTRCGPAGGSLLYVGCAVPLLSAVSAS